MKQISTEAFTSACCDYLWLQDKGYPQRLVFKIVGDRYQLNKLQRVILYRGIFPSAEAESRMQRNLLQLGKVNLSVDVNNVIFKLANYLCGRPVFICNDELLRDAGDAFDKEYSHEISMHAIRLLVEFLSSQILLSLNFYIDQPVDGSSQLYTELYNNIKHFSFPTTVHSVYPADRYLDGPSPHVVATADSEVIDQIPHPYIDLPRLILDKQFQPAFLNITDIIHNSV